MSNLKVNSKSSILEFKRKHNNLVESVEEISLDITDIQNALENCLGVIEIDSDDASESFENLGIAEKVLSGNYRLRAYYDSVYLEYIPIKCTSDEVVFIRIDNITTENIFVWYISVDGGEDTLEDMYGSEMSMHIYRVDGNPTLAGTEDDLTGLQIGDTKYKIPSKTKLYKHRASINLTITVNNGTNTYNATGTVEISILTTKSDAYTSMNSFLEGWLGSYHGIDVYLPTIRFEAKYSAGPTTITSVTGFLSCCYAGNHRFDFDNVVATNGYNVIAKSGSFSNDTVIEL